jgi:myo-inositol-1(or 4)-monophosphatase
MFRRGTLLMDGPEPDDALLARIEGLAVELARLGGAEIRTALGTLLEVAYKGAETDPQLLKDPVSEIDRRVEVMIRARLSEEFPEHDIIGEELDERPGRGHDWVWAVDPIDGTTNFVNGFPLFASCVGVLFRGHPVVGALWCSTSHSLSPGVYHARKGRRLHFDGAELDRAPNPAVRRRLAGVPDAGPPDGPWDLRKTGSAAIECAFVAAGLLQVARFAAPNLWDVAGGVALVEAAGGAVWERAPDGWRTLEEFGRSGEDLKHWRAPLILGERSAAEQMVRLSA